MRRPAGSWSNDQLSSAFTAPAARLSSRTVQQSQKWSPELPYSSRTGPAQQRADHAAKSRHLTSATQVAGAKNLPNEPPGGSSKIPRVESTGPGWWATDRPDCPPGGSATYTRGPHTPRRFLQRLESSTSLYLASFVLAMVHARTPSILLFIYAPAALLSAVW